MNHYNNNMLSLFCQVYMKIIRPKTVLTRIIHAWLYLISKVDIKHGKKLPNIWMLRYEILFYKFRRLEIIFCVKLFYSK